MTIRAGCADAFVRSPGFRFRFRRLNMSNSFLSRWWHAVPPWRRRLRIAVGILLIVVLLVRLAAPYVLKSILERALASTDGFRGTIGSTSLSFTQLSYHCGPVHLEGIDARNGSYFPLVDVRSLTVDVDWANIFSDPIADTLTLNEPVYHLYLDETKKGSELLVLGSARPPAGPASESSGEAGKAGKAGKPELERWQDHLSRLALFRLDTIDVRQGSVLVQTVDGKATLGLTQIDAGVIGLVTGMNPQRAKAAFHLHGLVAESGMLHLEGEVEPLATKPDFTVKASLEELELPRLNPLSSHFKHLTFKKGHLLAYVDLASTFGQGQGTLKLIFRDLDIATFSDKSGSLAVTLFWKAVVPIAENILENSDKSQHAAVIPLDGPLEDPNTDNWDVMVSILTHAFIRAIVPGYGRS